MEASSPAFTIEGAAGYSRSMLRSSARSTATRANHSQVPAGHALQGQAYSIPGTACSPLGSSS
eukprot:1341326-Heterocapsa_arctica.AAC.1